VSRRVLITLLACAPLMLPAAASGAYDPSWSFRFGDSRAAVAPSVTSILTLPSGNSATSRVSVVYPPDFGFNPGFAVNGCTPAQEQADACPESSRIGTTRGVTALGEFSGPMYLTEDFRLRGYLRGVAGLGAEFEGRFYIGGDGSVETVFDNLPNFQATQAEISVQGGSRGILLTPRRCGRYTVKGTFTSHAGETARRTVPVEISRCAARPVISRLRARPRRFRRRTVLSWRLSQAVPRTSISVQRLGRGGWRELRRLRGPGSAGRNSLRLSGRRLRPGRYRFVAQAKGRTGMLSRARSARARRVP
jgi:hypothetical protein